MIESVQCYIPAYNNSDSVQFSLASVRGWKVVIPDNASSPEQQLKLDQLHGPNVAVIHHPQNLGRIGAWRFCVEHFLASDATWFKWLFAGDELTPNAAEAFEDSSEAFPTARYIIGQFEFVLPDRRRRWTVFPEPRTIEPVDALLMAVHHGNVFGGVLPGIFHREALEAGYTFGEGAFEFLADGLFSMGIARRFPVLYIPDLVGLFHVAARKHFVKNTGSLSNMLEESLFRCMAAEYYRELTNDKSARDHLIATVLQYVRSWQSRPDHQLIEGGYWET